MYDRWCSSIDKITQQFQTAFGTLTQDQINWKPEPDAWSIAQNIDHIITVNKTYFPVIKNLRAGHYKVPFHARFSWVALLLGRVVLNAVKPDRKKKIKTFPIWEPSSSSLPSNLVDQFSLHQIELKTVIQTCSDLVQRNTVISSPANKSIVYKLETAFDIIVAHELRHYEQTKEVLILLKNHNSTSPLKSGN